MPADRTLPPLTLPTLGGKQLWADVFVYHGFRVQENAVTGHHRLLGPGNGRVTSGTYDECIEAFDRIKAERGITRGSDHLVLLLHGIFRAKEAFDPMASALREAGYEAEPVNYPSTQRTIESHAEQIEHILEHARDVTTVSFVTHSMGGLVARELLARKGAWRKRLKVNRLVMIATPNQGAEMANHLLPMWLYRRLAGPAGTQLTPDYVADFPVPDCPFGIVAGARGDGKGYNPLLEGDDDVTVSVRSTHLEGAEDTLIVNAIHTFIMQHTDVIEGTIHYLRTGRFKAGEAG